MRYKNTTATFFTKLALAILITVFFNTLKTPIAIAQSSNPGSYTDICTPPTISNIQTYNVKTLGGIGDGNPHPLSERYATLAEAQAAYPRAKALTDEIDDMVIQKAVDNASTTGGGKIYFPAGTYIVDREVVGGANNTGAIAVIGAQNLIFEGDGIGQSIIKMKVKTWAGDSHILLSSYSSNLIFRNLTFDGSRTTATFPDEQMHGLYFKVTQNILIENVKFYQLRGDGIFTISDDAALWTENMTVQSSEFYDNGRAGAAHQGGTRRACYVSNRFEKMHGQDLDFEATGDRRAAEDVWILNNTTTRSNDSYSIAPTGLGTTKKALRYRIIGNTIGGGVFPRTVDDFIFENNTIVNTGTQPTIQIGGASNARIKNNTIEGGDPNVNQPLLYIRANEPLTNVEISTNTFIQHGTFEDPWNRPSGIFSEDFNGDNVTIDRNKIVGAGNGFGINLAGVVDGNVNDSNTIRDNTIQNFKQAIQIGRRSAAPNTRYTNLLIAGNTLADTQTTPTQTFGIELSYEDIILGSNIAVADNVFGRGLVTAFKTNLTPVIVSQLEQASCGANGITGWSFDSSGSSSSTQVRIFVDNTSIPVATISTTVVRSDINTLFGITGTHGFQFSLPSQFKDDQNHQIYAGAVYLDGSFGAISPISKTVQCGETTPPVISNLAIAKTGYRTAIFSWTTNEPAKSRIEFGVNVSYGTSTVLTNSNTTTHYLLVSGMIPGALHHFRVASMDAAGNTATSTDFTITTKARLIKPPKLPSLSARAGSVILNWGTLDYDLCERIEIFRSTTGFVQTSTPTALIATVGCADITYTDTTTAPATTYYYSLMSTDDQGTYSDPTTIGFTTAASSGGGGYGSGGTSFGGNVPTSSAPSSTTTTPQTPSMTPILLQIPTSAPSETPTSISITVPVSPVFNRSLNPGFVGNDILRLQKLLNTDPATRVSNSGAGSPGRETNYFGPLTQRAVQKFQKKYKIISFGSPKTTGYGRLGPKTLAKFTEVFGADFQKVVDTDGDGLSDDDETLIWHSDPLNPDTDGDGYPDGHEVENGYSPIWNQPIKI